MFSRSRGFTLLELLIAVTIGALLLAVAVPVYTDYADRARVGQAIADLGSLDLRIERYVADTFRPPGTLADLPGTIPVDPWGRAYRYLRIEGEAPTILSKVRKDGKMIPVNGDYDLYSVGPDGKTVPPLVANDSYDDVVRAGNGGFIGVAADF